MELSFNSLHIPCAPATNPVMSLHSYSRIWLHLVWGTLEHKPLFSKSAAAKTSQFLSQYASEKGIYMRLNYVNPEHVHALIDLPTNLCIEEAVQLLKGASSHWINASNLMACKFTWGRGYGAFSVSQSALPDVGNYIAGQEEHHRKKTFAEEVQQLLKRYELKWREDANC